MNPIPDQPREMWVIKKAREFIRQAGICWLPVKPFEICKRFTWEVFTAGQVTKRTGIPRQDVLFGQDSDVYYWEGKYKIIYNERAYPVRIPYSITHEIGHVVLNHLIDFEQTRLSRGGLTDEEYWVLEREAEIFAAELLMPLPVLRILKVSEPKKIMSICNISKTTARIRSEEIQRSFAYDNLDDDDWMQQQFRLYLHPVAVCANGQGKLIPEVRRVAEKKLQYVTTDGKNRFTACPRCGNTCFSRHANYCKMCGMYLYNTCINVEENQGWYACGKINPGDARFCEYCGTQTQLMELGLLMSWEEVIEVYGEVAAGLEAKSSELLEQLSPNEAPF